MLVLFWLFTKAGGVEFEVALKKYALLRIFLAVTEDFLQPLVCFLCFALQKGKKKCPLPQPIKKRHTQKVCLFFVAVV